MYMEARFALTTFVIFRCFWFFVDTVFSLRRHMLRAMPACMKCQEDEERTAVIQEQKGHGKITIKNLQWALCELIEVYASPRGVPIYPPPLPPVSRPLASLSILRTQVNKKGCNVFLRFLPSPLLYLILLGLVLSYFIYSQVLFSSSISMNIFFLYRYYF